MRQHFWLMYILLTMAQMLLCNYCNFSPYLTLTLLPAMVLCIPPRIRTLPALFIAFLTGFAVDLLAEGVLGLNIFALVPVALVRTPVCAAIFGDEVVGRGENFSVRKYGIAKVVFALLLAQGLFLLLYLWVDGATARAFSFNAWRFVVSLVAGTLLGLAVVHLLSPDERR